MTFNIIFRSTNPEEGEVLAWDICERFIRLIGVSNDGQYFDEADTPSTVSIRNLKYSPQLILIYFSPNRQIRR